MDNVDTIIEVMGREYKISAVEHNGKYFWTAFRQDGSYWRRIPTWTRAEERAFPKLLGLAANDFVTSLNDQVEAA